MRVAVSGTHRTGKTTLVEALADALPRYTMFAEPYVLLEEDGYELGHSPTVEDFEQQLRRSLDVIASTPANALFDRCPLDFLAYLRALDADVEDWLPDVRDAMSEIDLVVVLSIEARIAVSADEDPALRRRVDELVTAIVLEDAYDLELEVLAPTSSLDARVREVLAAIRG